PVSRSTSAMKSPPLSDSRVALVAAAMISSTLCDSASRLNLVKVCSAEVMAVGVRLRPSKPPAPSRALSFSRSTTSNERSCLTWTTIIWMELVPMSMAAMRMWGVGPGHRAQLVPLHGRYILALQADRFPKKPCQLGKSYHEPCDVPCDPIAAGAT